MSSPVRLELHGRPHGFVMLWLGSYAMRVPGLWLMDNSTVLVDDWAEVQPDAFLWRPESGGATLNDDGYLEGAPSFVVEVVASSTSYDLHTKKEAYRRSGVAEYVVWRVLDRAIDWFHLIDGAYVPVLPDADGVVESAQFPGLRLHLPSMLAGDLTAVVVHLDTPPERAATAERQAAGVHPPARDGNRFSTTRGLP